MTMAQPLRRLVAVLSQRCVGFARSPAPCLLVQHRFVHEEGDKKLDIKPPFTYQPDVGLANLHEIMDVIRNDPTYINNQYNNVNIFKAMTAFSSFEKPWWTTRDSNGNIVGFVLSTHVSDCYARMCNLYVSPEARGHNIAQILYEKAARSIDSPERSVQCGASIGGLIASKKCFPDLIVDEYRNMSVRYGIPKYDENVLHESGTGFSIIPYPRGHHLDQIVKWDEVNIHEVARPEFWEIFLDTSITKSYVAIDDKTKAVVGFSGIQSAFDTSCQIIAPLYADTDEVALVLFRHVMNHYKRGNHIILTHHEKNQLMESLFVGMDLPLAVPCVNYYTKFPFPSKKYWGKMYLNASNGITIQ